MQYSSLHPQTLLFAWYNLHFLSNLAVRPPVLWKVFPFNSHKATGSASFLKCLVSSCWTGSLNSMNILLSRSDCRVGGSSVASG